jgi:hypothetical protein
VFKMVNNYISMFSSGDLKVRTTDRSDYLLNSGIINECSCIYDKTLTYYPFSVSESDVYAKERQPFK